MIQISKLSKRFGPKELLQEATLEIKPKECIGLIGPNGSGKTTLLRVMCGEEDYDSGMINIPAAMKIGYLKQDVTLDANKSLLEEAMHGYPEIAKLESDIIHLEERISEHSEDKNLLNQYGKLREKFEQCEGYSLESRAKAILTGVGFDPKDFKRPMKNFSGGWMMRIALARLLLQQPDLLLMDEPTNHLDLMSVIWLENFIKNYNGTTILISHDYYFLDRTVTQIIEIDGKKLISYSGNYDFYLKEKELRRAQQEAQFKNQQKKIEKTEQFIERFRYKASKAKQVQSRVKMLEKIDKIELESSNKSMRFTLPQPLPSGKIIAELSGVKKQYGELTVYDALDFTITREDKIGLVGHNGAGKSTLLKILAEKTEIQAGNVKFGHNVVPYYYAQHQLDILNPQNSILEELSTAAEFLSEQQVRTLAGMFLFSNEDVFKKVSILSGGEKARVALAKMLANPANFLILDEPTNHLDIDSRRILQDALVAYQGTIIFITHDREFLNGIAKSIVEVEKGHLKIFAGDYEYYCWKKDEQNKAHAVLESIAKNTRSSQSNKKDDRKKRAQFLNEKQKRIGPLQKSLQELENEIGLGENAKDELTAAVCDPRIIADSSLLTEKSIQLKKITQKLEDDYLRWEDLSSKIEETLLQLDEEFGSSS